MTPFTHIYPVVVSDSRPSQWSCYTKCPRHPLTQQGLSKHYIHWWERRYDLDYEMHLIWVLKLPPFHHCPVLIQLNLRAQFIALHSIAPLTYYQKSSLTMMHHTWEFFRKPVPGPNKVSAPSVMSSPVASGLANFSIEALDNNCLPLWAPPFAMMP